MNKIIVIGNLGRDPEMRYTPSGQAVTNFSIASNRRYTTNGETRDETEWFTCSAWGRLAEVASQHLRKGQQIYIEGRLRSRTYTTQSGETRFSMDINVTEMQFLGGNREANGQPGGGQPAGGPAGGGQPAGGPAGGGQPAGGQAGGQPGGAPPPSNQDLEDQLDPDDLPF